MKKQKCHTIAMILSALAALLCLLPVLLLICGLALPPQYEETFLGEMKYKLQRLQATEGRRIVLVGGSSIPFSVKSELMEQSLPDYRVVDFGMYADMGTVVMLDWAKAEVHEGDIFIVMPEQNPQTLSCYFSGEDVWQAADGAFYLIPYLSADRYERLAAAFPVFAGKKLFYAIHGNPQPEGIYTRAAFNEYGDIAWPDRQCNIMPGGYNPNDMISLSEDVLSEDFIAELNAFAEEITARGGSVYYHFPPMNEQALAGDTTKARIHSYYDYLQSWLTFPILGDPRHCIMENGWFYDTNFHLNDSGAIVFTKALIEDLKILCLDTSLTDIALPAMPEILQSASEGDNSCADCFTYRRKQEGWFIDGLTEKGLAASALILPFSYEGEPIAGMSDTLFVGNTVLTELTVQSNMGILYDGMFQGCTGFTKLILTDPSPSAYIIGDSLMEGAQFLIYVPEQAIDSYRRHYSWQKYSSYLMTE